MKKLIQRLVLIGTLALAAIGSYKLGNERGVLKGKIIAYNCVDNLAKITTERLLDNPLINQNRLDLAGKRVIKNSDSHMHPIYDYIGISCNLLGQAAKREEANDLEARDSLTNYANQLLDYYSVLQEIEYNRIANWCQKDSSNAK